MAKEGIIDTRESNNSSIAELIHPVVLLNSYNDTA